MGEIIDWLSSLGLAEYAPRFIENRVDFEVLTELSDQDLKELGVAALGDRRKLLRAIAARAAAGREEHSGAAVEAAGKTTAAATSDHGQTKAPIAERRHLTVMFCDLVGSTALAARLDPEDVREVVRAYQGACAQVIGRYEGFVAQYLGDGIMAYFGYPQAHEDDAERAVRAGLEIVAAVAKLDTKVKVEVRVGIATGLVVVGDLLGEGGNKERAVTGETPNLAARLQGLAPPGTVLVSAATRRLLGGQFALRDLGPQQIKGLDVPVTAFAVEGLRSFESRFEARAGGLTGFIGREDECAHLLERWKLARQGRGQVVLISGEAGIGKSRLTAWLVETIASEPHTRLRYQCTPHHKDSALYPTIAQLERAAAIEPNEPAEQRLAKLEGVLALAGLASADTVPLFAALLAIPTGDRYPPLAMSPGQQRQRTMAALLDQVEALAKQKPLLMIYEDAHWADATSLESLDALVDRVARLPVLLVITGRPEFSPTWAGRHNVSTVSLHKLDKRETRAMVESVCGGAMLPPELLEQIVQKTDGVPLFVEELTKTVLEAGAAAEEGTQPSGAAPALPIPATLQDSLMARLDRSNPVKEIAQIGAAIGREFSYKLLIAVAGMDEASLRTGLAKLEEAELATRRGVPPDATYTFKHALVQDAAYESLLKSRRQVIHRRIAKALRDKFPAIAEIEPEIIAHHFTQGGRAERAVRWWIRAGELAQTRFAHQEVIAHFRQAARLLHELPESSRLAAEELQLQIALGNAMVAGQGYSSADEPFRRALALASKVGDIRSKVVAYWGVWVGAYSRSELARARILAEEFASEFDGVNDKQTTSLGQRMLGLTKWSQGEFTQSIPHLNWIISNYDFERDSGLALRSGADPAAIAMAHRLFPTWILGKVDEARAQSEVAMAHARRTRHMHSVGYTYSFVCVVEAMREDWSRTLQVARVLVNMSIEHALPEHYQRGMILMSWSNWLAGDRRYTISQIETSMKYLNDAKSNHFAPIFSSMYADVISLDNLYAGIDCLQQALIASRSSGQQWFDAELHRKRALLLQRNRLIPPSTVQDELEHALSISRQQLARSFELRASFDLARLYRDTDRENEAKALLTRALVGFTETPELPEIGKAQRLLASLQ